jgi:hypothetical protein
MQLYPVLQLLYQDTYSSEVNMDLIQWDKSALLNLMGNTNGNTEWLFCYMDTDQLVPLMEETTSLNAFQYFAQHCISTRILLMRAINNSIVDKFASILYNDANRIFHHRGTLDVPSSNLKRIVPVNQYIENINELSWLNSNIPFYSSALINSSQRSQNILIPMQTKLVFEFHDLIEINSINYSNALSSVASNRPDFLQIEYKTDLDQDWISLPEITANNASTSLQTFLINVSCKALRVGSRKTSLGTNWLFDTIQFNTLMDKHFLGEEVRSLIMIPIPNSGHVNPSIWGTGVKVFAFGLNELKMNILKTDRFVELGVIASRLSSKAVIL